MLLKARNICKLLSFFIKPKKKFICNRKSKIYMDIKLSEAFDVFQEHVLWDIPWGRSMRLRSAITGEQSARMDNGGSWTIWLPEVRWVRHVHRNHGQRRANEPWNWWAHAYERHLQGLYCRSMWRLQSRFVYLLYESISKVAIITYFEILFYKLFHSSIRREWGESGLSYIKFRRVSLTLC